MLTASAADNSITDECPKSDNKMKEAGGSGPSKIIAMQKKWTTSAEEAAAAEPLCVRSINGMLTGFACDAIN